MKEGMKMAYTKVWYHDIRRITNDSQTKCNKWLECIYDINNNLTSIKDAEIFKGNAADSIKNYIDEVHGILISTLYAVLNDYSYWISRYYCGYRESVDTGIGSEKEIHKTKIVFREVCDDGIIIKELNELYGIAGILTSEALAVRNRISYLANISSYPKYKALQDDIELALEKIKKINSSVEEYENAHTNDLQNIGELRKEAEKIIEYQLGNERKAVMAYQKGNISLMCNYEDLCTNFENVSTDIEDFVNSEEYESTMQLAAQSLEQEAYEEREWVHWVAGGVAILCSVTVIVVSAGTASPLVVASVSAVTSMISTTANQFAENYVENGDVLKGMDWSKCTREVLTSGVTGFITGCFGATSTGSAIKQPLKAAGDKFIETVIKEGAELGVNVALDVAEGVAAGKSLEDITTNMQEHAWGTLKDIVVEGGKAAIGAGISQHYKISQNGSKKVMDKVTSSLVENSLKEGYGIAVEATWDTVGECVVSDKDFLSILVDNLAEEASGAGGRILASTLEAGIEGLTDDVDNKAVKVVGKTAADTVSKTIKGVGEGIQERWSEYHDGERSDMSEVIGTDVIWEEDLKGGNKILENMAESTVESVAENITEERKKSTEFERKLKANADKDGNVEVYKLNRYSVTKEDYDAAVKNAGKGAYKEKTAQQILGVGKEYKLDNVEKEKVAIDDIRKYSKGDRKNNKYIYVKSF